MFSTGHRRPSSDTSSIVRHPLIFCSTAPTSSWKRELFDSQPESYRDTVLPPSVRGRVSIEAASPFGWERYVGLDGAIISVDGFGASAPGPVVTREFGLTTERVVEVAQRVLGRN
jgi:transketolase